MCAITTWSLTLFVFLQLTMEESMSHVVEETGGYFNVGHPSSDTKNLNSSPIKRCEHLCRMDPNGEATKKYKSNEFDKTCKQYLNENFLPSDQSYFADSTVLPPKYLDSMSCRETLHISEMINRSIKRTSIHYPGVLIKEYNSSSHASFIFENYVEPSERTFDNRILLFNVGFNTILNIRVTTGKTCADVHKEMERCVDDITEFQVVNKENLQGSGIILIPIVVARHLEEDVNLELFTGISLLCDLCKFNIITSNNIRGYGRLENISDWFDKILTSKIEHLRFIFSVEMNNQEDIHDSFKGIISQIVGYMASFPSYLPFFTTKPGTQIENLMLNLDQAYAVTSPKNHKIIVGPYGAGKSVVIKLQLEHLLKCLVETTFIYFVSFDPYSILDVFLESHIAEFLQIINKVHLCRNIHSTNVAAIGTALNIGLHPTISVLLEALQRKHKPNNQLFHLIIDELNLEEIRSIEADNIKRSLKDLPDSTVMLVAQSLQKHFVFERNGERLPTEGYRFQKTGMEMIELRKCMRTTVNTHNAITTAQEVVTSSPTTLYVPKLCTYKKKTFLSKMYGKGIQFVSVSKKVPESKVTTYSADQSQLNIDHGHVDVEPYVLGKSYLERERVHRMTSSVGNRKMSSSSTSTFYDFVSSDGIGHAILGSKPKLVDLENWICNIKNLKDFKTLSKKVITMLAFAASLEEYITATNCVILCNDLVEIETISDALTVLGKVYVEYASYARLPQVFPSKLHKEKVVQELITNEAIILTDRRSFRGMETNNLILCLDVEESFESYQVVENLARSTSNVTFLAYGDTRKIKQKVSALVNLIDEWRKDNLVEIIHIPLNKEKVIQWMEKTKTLQLPPKRKLDNTSNEIYSLVMHPGTIAYPEVKSLSKTSFEIKWICGSGSSHEYVIERRHLDKSKWIHVATVNSNNNIVNGLLDYWLYEYKVSVLLSNAEPVIISFLQNSNRKEIERYSTVGLNYLIRDKDDVDMFKRVLNISPWRVHETDDLNSTLYHEAAMYNRHRILQFLCEQDVTHINDVDAFNQTALHWASSEGSVECIEILLRHQADWRIKNEYGRTPHDLAYYDTRQLFDKYINQ